MYDVRVGRAVTERAHERYGEERGGSGRPSEYDFVGGPLNAAVREFAFFDELPELAGPAVRSLIIVDPFFGALVFVGVLIGTRLVEIAEVDDDADYWSLVDPTD